MNVFLLSVQGRQSWKVQPHDSGISGGKGRGVRRREQVQ
jgi:hypothetical protein